MVENTGMLFKNDFVCLKCFPFWKDCELLSYLGYVNILVIISRSAQLIWWILCIYYLKKRCIKVLKCCIVTYDSFNSSVCVLWDMGAAFLLERPSTSFYMIAHIK